MKDPLLGNKIAAALLTALLLVFGLPQFAGMLFGGGHGGGKELHLAYCCVELDFAEAAAAEEEAPYDLGLLLANANPASGERRVAVCKSCHSFEEGGPNGTGPNLYNKIGTDIASKPGFNYSSALASLDGVWTWERMDKYLQNSQEYVPNGGMVQRIARDEQRADIIAYLGSLSPNAPPYPEPIASAGGGEESAGE